MAAAGNLLLLMLVSTLVVIQNSDAQWTVNWPWATVAKRPALANLSKAPTLVVSQPMLRKKVSTPYMPKKLSPMQNTDSKVKKAKDGNGKRKKKFTKLSKPVAKVFKPKPFQASLPWDHVPVVPAATKVAKPLALEPFPSADSEPTGELIIDTQQEGNGHNNGNHNLRVLKKAKFNGLGSISGVFAPGGGYYPALVHNGLRSISGNAMPHIPTVSQVRTGVPTAVLRPPPKLVDHSNEMFRPLDLHPMRGMNRWGWSPQSLMEALKKLGPIYGNGNNNGNGNVNSHNNGNNNGNNNGYELPKGNMWHGLH